MCIFCHLLKMSSRYRFNFKSSFYYKHCRKFYVWLWYYKHLIHQTNTTKHLHVNTCMQSDDIYAYNYTLSKEIMLTDNYICNLRKTSLMVHYFDVNSSPQLFSYPPPPSSSYLAPTHSPPTPCRYLHSKILNIRTNSEIFFTDKHNFSQNANFSQFQWLIYF